jgi:NADPH:quinone reductase-like Zn-dependent oxidoreductase
MKQIIFKQTGAPETVLELQEVDIPQPKSHEVRIKVTARNINPSDIMFVRGMYGITPKLPSSAGFEAVGIVDLADEKGFLKTGQKVIFTAIGTWKEYVCVAAQSVIPVPDSMPDAIACQAFVNPMTAYAMIEESGLKADQWLLVTAGASAFGKLAIQMAKEKGIKVAVTVRRDDQIEGLQQLGADLVINTEKEKLPKFLLEQIPDGVDVVFDAVGGNLGARALACLKTGGTMMVFGLLSLENIPLNSGLLIFKNITIKGFWLSSWVESLDDAKRSSAFKTVLGYLMSQKVKVDVQATFPLEEYKEALAAYEASGRNGKILLCS